MSYDQIAGADAGVKSGRRAFLRTLSYGSVALAAGGTAACAQLGVKSSDDSGTSKSGGKTKGDASAPQEFDVTYWSSGNISKSYKAGFAVYTAQHKNVKVLAQFAAQGPYFQKLNTELAGGSPPDIFQLHAEGMGDYVAQGSVMDLDQFIPNTLSLDKLPANIADSCRFNGKTMVVPLGLATQPAMVYNKKMLDGLGIDPPSNEWSFDDLKTFAGNVTKASKGKLFGVSDGGGYYAYLEGYIRGMGKQLFTEEGKLGFTRDDLSAWFGLWDGLRKSALCVPMKVSAASTGFPDDPLVTRKTPIEFVSSGKGLGNITPLLPDESHLVAFPKVTASGPQGTLVTPIEWFALYSKLPDDRAQAAAAMLDFYISNPAAVKARALVNGVPVFPDLRSQLQASASGTDAEIYKNVADVSAQNPSARIPYPSGSGDLLDSVSDLNQEIGFSKMSISVAVNTFFTAAAKAKLV